MVTIKSVIKKCKNNKLIAKYLVKFEDRLKVEDQDKKYTHNEFKIKFQEICNELGYNDLYTRIGWYYIMREYNKQPIKPKMIIKKKTDIENL